MWFATMSVIICETTKNDESLVTTDIKQTTFCD